MFPLKNNCLVSSFPNIKILQSKQQITWNPHLNYYSYNFSQEVRFLEHISLQDLPEFHHVKPLCYCFI